MDKFIDILQRMFAIGLTSIFVTVALKYVTGKYYVPGLSDVVAAA